MKVIIFGAGGPVAQSAIDALQDHHQLVLTDLKPLQSDRHETRVLNITDPRQVEESVRGMDSIINCAVLRHDPKLGFDVTVRGCYNVLRAAVRQGIPRVLHTSCHLSFSGHPGSYLHEFGVDEKAPFRPGTGVYFITKYLAHELCAMFAEQYGLEIIAFHYGGFHGLTGRAVGIFPFYTHPEDAGQAFKLGLEVKSLPSKYEIFHITGEFPHQQYPIEKAKRLLGFRPKHNFVEFYRKTPPAEQKT